MRRLVVGVVLETVCDNRKTHHVVIAGDRRARSADATGALRQYVLVHLGPYAAAGQSSYTSSRRKPPLTLPRERVVRAMGTPWLSTLRQPADAADRGWRDRGTSRDRRRGGPSAGDMLSRSARRKWSADQR